MFRIPSARVGVLDILGESRHFVFVKISLFKICSAWTKQRRQNDGVGVVRILKYFSWQNFVEILTTIRHPRTDWPS